MRRQRKVGEAMRSIDEETRMLIAQDRLAQLERDQAATSIDAVGGDNDIWEPSDQSDSEGKVHRRKSSTVGKGRISAVVKGETVATRGNRRVRRTIEMVLMEEPASLPNQDTFLSVEVPSASKTPGARPPHKLCSVCSYPSAYNCVRCGSNFCSLQCNGIHRETKCLKFAD